MAEHSGAIGALVAGEIPTHSITTVRHARNTESLQRRPKIACRAGTLTLPPAEPASSYIERRHLQPDAELSDIDLLLCLLSAGGRRDVVRGTASRLLDQFGTFAAVIAASPSDLAHFGGLAQAQIFALKATQIAALRVVRSHIETRPILADMKQLRDYLMARLGNQPREEFHVLFLDVGNCLIADETIATGTVNWVAVKPRQIVECTLKWQATALILSHNHPSGNPNPSVEDIITTECIIEALTAIEVLVHDHVILSKTGVFSLREAGLLPRTSAERRRSAASKW